MTYTSKCKNCGKEKEFQYKSYIKDCCSYKCAREFWYKNNETKTEYLELICKYCGKKFKLTKSSYKVRTKCTCKPKYCCKECSNKGRMTGKNVICEICGKEFYSTKHIVCSVKCSGAYRKKYEKHKRSGFWYEKGYKVLYTENDNSIKEHIKIIEEKIGRKLRGDEVVHHLNGIKDDNRVENLQLMTRGEHSSLHRNIEKNEGKKFFGK